MNTEQHLLNVIANYKTERKLAQERFIIVTAECKAKHDEWALSLSASQRDGDRVLNELKYKSNRLNFNE